MQKQQTIQVVDGQKRSGLHAQAWWQAHVVLRRAAASPPAHGLLEEVFRFRFFEGHIGEVFKALKRGEGRNEEKNKIQRRKQERRVNRKSNKIKIEPSSSSGCGPAARRSGGDEWRYPFCFSEKKKNGRVNWSSSSTNTNTGHFSKWQYDRCSGISTSPHFRALFFKYIGRV